MPRSSSTHDKDPETLIRVWSNRILHKVQQVVPGNPSEADFRHAVEPLLDEFCVEIGVNPLAHAEYTLATGRADAVFNRLVIEYERPGVLKKSMDQATRHAIKQAEDYVKDLAKKEGHQLHRLGGVAFDGRHLVFGRYINEKWSAQPPVEVTEHSLERFLTWLASLSSGIALTPENLNQDFAIEQLRTQNILRALNWALGSALPGPEGLVSKLFDQWRLFFGESIDYSEAFGGRKLDPLRKWVRKAGIRVDTPDEAERFFFALHTYFALLVKLLAWLALSRHLAVKLGGPSFGELATADSDTLRRRLQDMESGGIFRAYGITNLLEGDFFAWYLSVWNEQIDGAVREILKRLDEYDPTTLNVVPEETRDLFKKLYHYLLPREIRHNLGEYYTPDWLAQRLLNQVDNEFFTSDPYRQSAAGRLRNKLLRARFLDPACGSGTFLVLVMARMRQLGDALMVHERDLLEAILNNVVGFDLNPLAVLTARVSYLLQLSTLLEHRRGEVVIPVYLADSVRVPAVGTDLFSKDAYEFPTAIGKFLVPAPLCTKDRFDRFCDLLEDSVRSGLTSESFVRRVESQLMLSASDWGDQASSRLRALYEQILEYHRKGMNGLWARLLKNNFAPLTVGQFDYVVGNPPWVNWESLPDGYRDAIKPLWQHYGLFPHGGMDTILGKGKKDIAILMTYVVADKLLKNDGHLGFVITQSVFKASGAGQGFRRFRIPVGDGRAVPLRPLHVDEMVDLNPFEGASNRTVVMVLEKGRRLRFPVDYTVWRKNSRARFTYDSALQDVTAATKRLNYAAEPIDKKDATSAWLTARPLALKAIDKVLGKSDYGAHAGAYTGGANAVYWVDVVLRRPDGLVVVRNLVEGAKVEVAEVTEAIEPDLLYPLIRGRDVQRWRAAPSAFILMVQDPVKRRGRDQAELQECCPRTYGYLKQFEGILRSRRSRGVSDMIKKGAPFYTMFAVGDYTFAPWKVVWREQAEVMTAAVVGEVESKAIIPDHKLMLVDCASEDEAHYVCALLNCTVVRLAVLSYAIEIQMDPHILEHIRVPRFDPGNPAHRRLAALSVQAHKAAQIDDLGALKRIESEIDAEAARLWGITDRDLMEIERNLQELSNRADE